MEKQLEGKNANDDTNDDANKKRTRDDNNIDNIDDIDDIGDNNAECHKSKKTKLIKDEYSSIVCPISQQIYKEPVLASDGYIYEENCIKEWMIDNRSSPITREELSNNLTIVYPVKNMIEEFLRENPKLKELQYNNIAEYYQNRKLVWSLKIYTRKKIL